MKNLYCYEMDFKTGNIKNEIMENVTVVGKERIVTKFSKDYRLRHGYYKMICNNGKYVNVIKIIDPKLSCEECNYEVAGVKYQTFNKETFSMSEFKKRFVEYQDKKRIQIQEKLNDLSNVYKNVFKEDYISRDNLNFDDGTQLIVTKKNNLIDLNFTCSEMVILPLAQNHIKLIQVNKLKKIEE
jgi:hypothetical protein